MGPRVAPDFSQFELRPFSTSAACQNLRRHGQAVFFVTDDAELIAQTVTGRQPEKDRWFSAQRIDGFVLTDACRAYELKVSYSDFSGTRGVLVCQVEHVHRLRDFSGFNRAKHAVIEGAILASRIQFLPRVEIDAKWDWLRSMVEKTGDDAERRAWELLTNYIESSLPAATQ
jgi:hypothetical protein